MSEPIRYSEVATQSEANESQEFLERLRPPTSKVMMVNPLLVKPLSTLFLTDSSGCCDH